MGRDQLMKAVSPACRSRASAAEPPEGGSAARRAMLKDAAPPPKLTPTSPRRRLLGQPVQRKTLLRDNYSFCHSERKSCPERSRMGRGISHCSSDRAVRDV